MREGWVETTVEKLVNQKIIEKPLDGNHGEIHPKKSDFTESGIPFIMASDLVKGAVNQETCNFISREQADSLRKGFAKNGDVLLSHKGTIGRSAILQTSLDYVVLTPQVTYYRILDNSVLDNRFLYYSFHNPKFQNEIKKIAGAGSTRAYIGITQQLQLHIPIAPLPEQKRIVAILHEAFEGIDRAIANTEKNLVNARAIFESYLNTIFTQKGDGWVEKKLGDTELIQIIDGDRGTNYPQKSDFSNAGHCLFLNTKNVRPDGFNFETTMFITEEKDNLLRKGKLKRRDVIITTRGTIGNIAIYDDSVEFEHIRINSGMLIFRPNENIIKSEYLFEILRSSIMKSQIEKFTSGAAQPQLPIKTLVSFSFPVPISLEEQAVMAL